MSEQIKTILPAILGLVIPGLWLAYNLGIFRYFNKIKINDTNKILVPSLFVLISPFILSIAFNEDLYKFSKIIDIEPLLSILTAVISIYSANWFLEKYRRRQKREEVVKLLSASLIEHLNYLQFIKRYLENPELSKNRFNYIDMYVIHIENDEVYHLSLNHMGLFPREIIKEITQYSSGSKYLMAELKRASTKEAGNSAIIEWLKRITDSNRLEAGFCLMSLNKKVIDDKEAFDQFKELVKEDYCEIKLYTETPDGSAFKLGDSLKNIKKLFEEFGFANELEDCYAMKKEKLMKVTHQ